MSGSSRLLLSHVKSILHPTPAGNGPAEHSLARSANGTLYAVYGGKALYMATKGPSDTDWSVQVVDPSYRVGKHNSVDLDSNGYPHISYAVFSENVALKYARWDGSAWQIETWMVSPISRLCRLPQCHCR